ncbi:MAG TPA: HD domain-containing phosphohydrolase [Verrucomicrobiae bacterium]|jgi:response regulator RpfG family c-di-GMP phosphodiesterase|nr:HD domain-containing phosphohydrolase [Verrucomicrobiae bacterium]
MKKILLVDDEQMLLDALRLSLRKQFPIETACGPIAGLAALKNWQDFSVVVSDMRMPEMTGVEFLAKVKEFAPDVVRIMLTANIDQGTAIQAVNEGNVFRFLNKPCTVEELTAAINAGIRQYQLITAEHDLLENTLRGSVKILTEILALADSTAFGHAEKVRDEVRGLCAALKIENSWELEVAALLSHIGFMTIPAETILKFRSGKTLTAPETELFRQIPAMSGRLLSQISRLEGVSKILTYQGKHFDGTGEPADSVRGTALPQGARMLKFLYDLVELETEGTSRSAALALMRTRAGWYDPAILAAYDLPEGQRPGAQSAPSKPALEIDFSQLRVGHVLCADVLTKDGTLIVISGNRITPTLMERLRNFNGLSGISEPILIEG